MSIKCLIVSLVAFRLTVAAFDTVVAWFAVLISVARVLVAVDVGSICINCNLAVWNISVLIWIWTVLTFWAGSADAFVGVIWVGDKVGKTHLGAVGSGETWPVFSFVLVVSEAVITKWT